MSVRLTTEERGQIEQRAAEFGLKVRDYGRRMMLNGGEIANPKDRDAAIAALAKLAFQTRRLGVSLNQIAHAANVTGSVPLAATLRPILDDLGAVTTLIKSALAQIEGEP
ncbi:MAG: hypothetical protein HY055_09290 [Magnetospirillum sp.]|nr:hypothetical protein [Magnetospirillum sp.]